MLLKNAVILSSSLLVASVLIGCGQDRSSPLPVAEKSSSAQPPDKNQADTEWTLVTLRIDGFKKSKSGGT